MRTARVALLGLFVAVGFFVPTLALASSGCFDLHWYNNITPGFPGNNVIEQPETLAEGDVITVSDSLADTNFSIVTSGADNQTVTYSPGGSRSISLTIATGGTTTLTVRNNTGQNTTYIIDCADGPAPTVTSVSANNGSTNGGQSVTITGARLTGAASVSFGGTGASFAVVNGTTITATTPVHGAGTVDVAVSTPGGTGTGGGVFTYIAPPSVTSVTANIGPLAGGTNVTIAGSGFTGATSVTFGGTAATSVSVVNASTITATTPLHAAGAVDVVVTGPYGAGTGTGAFTYVGAPTISNISPSKGPLAGSSVTISGTNFVGAATVTFDGSAATNVSVVNSTTITATTPAHGAGGVTVVVATVGGSASNGGYAYVGAPTVTSVGASKGPLGGSTNVTITGTNFTDATAVTFGGAAATNVVVASDTSITATTPAHAEGSVDVVVTAPGGTGTGTGVYSYVASPTVTSVNAKRGPLAGNSNVTITGTKFTDATAVTFGGAAATNVVVASDTSITATTPAHAAGAVDVVVTTPGGDGTGSGKFTYAAAPAVTAVSPNKGALGGNTSVTITGTDLTDATVVTFGGMTATNVAVVDDTHITAKTPAHAAGVVDVKVTAPGGAGTGSGKFTYVEAPAVTALAPNSGFDYGGTRVTITGTGFTDVSAVKFGTSAASSFTVRSATSIVAVSPPGSGNVRISVTAAGGTSANAGAASRFTYTKALTTLYKFKGGTDGETPFGGLIADKKGALFGTTYGGGAAGDGTVFKLTPPAAAAAQASVWTKAVLYSFTGKDGANPYASLVADTTGALYGTTLNGGAHNRGVVFKLTPKGTGWTQTVLHSFAGGTDDGADPYGALIIDEQGVLYGTAALGGASNKGVAFRLTPPAAGKTDWGFALLYSFTGGNDGATPKGPLSLNGGMLYGATVAGGVSNKGAAFQLAPKARPPWRITTMHGFTPSEATNPYGGLYVGTDGTMFGLGSAGGTARKGALFRLTKVLNTPPSWGYATLYSFLGGTDGAGAFATLTGNSAGVLYGTTRNGAAADAGTVFKFAAGRETLLHAFTGADGAEPHAGVLLGKKNVLYGTTSKGGIGCGDAGCGTVFMVGQ